MMDKAKATTKTMTAKVLAASSVALVRLGSAAVFGMPANYNVLSGGATPVNSIRVINSDHPYNTDENTMDFIFYVTQNEFGDTNFFAGLKSRIEIGTSGTQVYNMLGFQDARG